MVLHSEEDGCQWTAGREWIGSECLKAISTKKDFSPERSHNRCGVELYEISVLWEVNIIYLGFGGLQYRESFRWVRVDYGRLQP